MTMEFIKYRSGYKYQLAEDYEIRICIKPKKVILTEFISLFKDGTLIIKAGYACDGPSGPTIDTLTFMRGAFCHDAIYQLIRQGYLGQEHREPADQELRRILLEDGMWKIRAWYAYHAVRLGGGPSASKSAVKKIHIAPKQKDEIAY